MKMSISKSGVKGILAMIERLYPTMNPAELDAAVGYARMAAELISRISDDDTKERLEAVLGAPLDAYIEQCRERGKSTHGIGAAEEIECYLKMLFAVLLIQSESREEEIEIL